MQGRARSVTVVGQPILEESLRAIGVAGLVIRAQAPFPVRP